MKTNERDLYRIAFESISDFCLLRISSSWISDDAVYFHCQSNTTQAIQWYFLSFNYYLMKTLPILYEYDMKIPSVEIADAGMYTCQTENTIHQRVILTVLRKMIVNRLIDVDLFDL